MSLTVTAGSELRAVDTVLMHTVVDLFKIPEQMIQREVDQPRGCSGKGEFTPFFHDIHYPLNSCCVSGCDNGSQGAVLFPYRI